jgi:hypothetical protein
MTESPNLDALNTYLMALPISSLKEPNLPINFAIDETLTLEKLALKDEPMLALRKLDWSLVTSLTQRGRALQEADTIYLLAQFGTGELLTNWKKTSAEGALVKEELVHGMVYAFDEDETLLDAVRAIMEGGSYSDLVQDLSDLEGFGRKYKDLLDAAGIDFKLIERAGELKIILGDLLAQTNVDKMEKSPEKIMRDRAFTYMAMAVEKIRKCGKSVFWKDPEHAAYYASAYMRKQRRKAERAKSAQTASAKEMATA